MFPPFSSKAMRGLAISFGNDLYLRSYPAKGWLAHFGL